MRADHADRVIRRALEGEGEHKPLPGLVLGAGAADELLRVAQIVRMRNIRGADRDLGIADKLA